MCVQILQLMALFVVVRGDFDCMRYEPIDEKYLSNNEFISRSVLKKKFSFVDYIFKKTQANDSDQLIPNGELNEYFIGENTEQMLLRDNEKIVEQRINFVKNLCGEKVKVVSKENVCKIPFV